jgi:hypothetical protein
MIPFKSGNLEFELPSKYGDLTFEQFYKIKDSDGKPSSIVSILSGIDKAILDRCSDLDLDQKLYPYLEFLKEPFDLHTYFVPDFIEVDGITYPKPKDLGLQTIGQKWHLEDLYKEVSEKGGTDVDLFPQALAIYLQPTITGTVYDSDKVEELIPKMMKVKLIEGWPLASFFLTNCEKQLQRNQKTFDMNLQRMSYEQELRNLQSSERFRQFSLFRRFLIKLLRRLFSLTITRSTLPSYMNIPQQNIKKS